MASFDPTEDDPAIKAGIESARRSHGDDYATYLIEHAKELFAKGYYPKPWPQSLIGNDGE